MNRFALPGTAKLKLKLQSPSLHKYQEGGIFVAVEPIPLEKGMLGDCLPTTLVSVRLRYFGV